MTVGTEHPSCFSIERRLFVVPSWSPYGAAETRRSLIASLAGGRSAAPVWRTRSSLAGAIGGGVFLALVAVMSWGVADLFQAAMLFVVGAVVGSVLGIGVRAIVVPDLAGRPRRTIEPPLPAVELPSDVARAAPDDSSDDELVLWATSVTRFRTAEEARNRESRLIGSHGSQGPVPPELSGRAAAIAAEYSAARADYEPVARLLGLPLG